MKLNIILIIVLVAFCFYQAGILTKIIWDYYNGATPIITPSELVKVLEHK